GLSRRDHDLEPAGRDTDDQPCRDRRSGARHQPGPDDPLISPLARAFFGRLRARTFAGRDGRPCPQPSGDCVNSVALVMDDAGVAGGWTRAGDYLALTKPRVVGMVLVTTLVGFYLGSDATFDLA